MVTDPALVARLDRLGARAWAPAGVPCYVAVRISVIHARRLAVPAAGPGRPVPRAAGLG